MHRLAAGGGARRQRRHRLNGQPAAGRGGGQRLAFRADDRRRRRVGGRRDVDGHRQYVSVSSQADTEKAALAEEQAELLEDYPGSSAN